MDNALEKLQKLKGILADLGPKVIACSGGVDSLLLSHFCHRHFSKETLVVHAEGPALPKEARKRFRDRAQMENWNCEVIQTGEFADEAYLKNPYDRCLVCKSHLYSALSHYRFDSESGQFYRVSAEDKDPINRCAILSGSNCNDLGEYRPGFLAAERFGVRHPFIEAGMAKSDIRAMCRHLSLDFSEVAASPCLSSRIYTGTPVTPEKLFIIDDLETWLRQALNLRVVRCRLKDRRIRIEVPPEDQCRVTVDVLENLSRICSRYNLPMESVALDPEPYRAGRAFVKDER